MQRLPSRGKATKPQPLQTVKSFSKHGASAASSSPSVEAPLEGPESPLSPLVNMLDVSIAKTPNEKDGNDFFETPIEGPTHEEEGKEEEEGEEEVDIVGAFSDDFDDLPVEIQSLMERFLESLASRVHPSPLSTERLSQLYQDFYEHAYGHINIHISALSAKISHEASPTPSVSGLSVSSLVKRRPPDRKGTLTALDQQMLTASEVTDRRKVRRQLEAKRLTMEEAVERGVCEKVYPRIWRHGSTDDEVRDERLRSRAAALSLVGVDLKELLSTAMSDNTSVPSELEKGENIDEKSCRSRLADARKSLESMNSDRFPLGKLNHLTEAHKHIVEALQDMFPSVSSADEVLPTLIYTIITIPPEKNSAISNFNFIQRFRASSKIDGEAAYCLTNLEAAISFLEHVDLSSIRAGEGPEGPVKSGSSATTPRTDIPDPLYRGLSSPNQGPGSRPRSPIAPPGRNRRLSTLRPFEAASDAVLLGADNIHSALDGGFKFLFGKLREKQSSSTHGSPVASAPKTLEDARKLVTPEATDETANADDAPADGKTQEEEENERRGTAMADKALELIIGRGALSARDRSADSNKSGTSSGKKPTPSPENAAKRAPPALATVPASMAPSPSSATPTPTPISLHPGAQALNAVESMRNLGNAINPMRGFGGFSMRGFGRTPSNSPLSPAGVLPVVVTSAPVAREEKAGPAFDFRSVGPAIQKFVECRDARELNFFDVQLLLRDYQRLAGAVRVAAEGV